MRPAPCPLRASSGPTPPASAAEPPSRRRTTSPRARGWCKARPASRCSREKERLLAFAFGRLDLFQLHYRAAQGDARGKGAGAAQVLGITLAHFVLVDAVHVDHRVAALAARALLQRNHRADEGDLAGF